MISCRLGQTLHTRHDWFRSALHHNFREKPATATATAMCVCVCAAFKQIIFHDLKPMSWSSIFISPLPRCLHPPWRPSLRAHSARAARGTQTPCLSRILWRVELSISRSYLSIIIILYYILYVCIYIYTNIMDSLTYLSYGVV